MDQGHVPIFNNFFPFLINANLQGMVVVVSGTATGGGPLLFQRWLPEEGKDEIPPVDCVVPLALAHSKVSGQQEINETPDE
jgi:hypothetical protein